MGNIFCFINFQATMMAAAAMYYQQLPHIPHPSHAEHYSHQQSQYNPATSSNFWGTSHSLMTPPPPCAPSQVSQSAVSSAPSFTAVNSINTPFSLFQPKKEFKLPNAHITHPSLSSSNSQNHTDSQISITTSSHSQLQHTNPPQSMTPPTTGVTSPKKEYEGVNSLESTSQTHDPLNAPPTSNDEISSSSIHFESKTTLDKDEEKNESVKDLESPKKLKVK